MEIVNRVVASAYAEAAASYVAPVRGGGQQRASARLAAKAAWQAEYYHNAELPTTRSRQVVRAEMRRLAKGGLAARLRTAVASRRG